VVFFYLLDALLSERKDRSILFWKSLPVSDTEVVVSKLATALIVAPVIVLLVSTVVQLLFGPIMWMRFHGSLVGDMMMPWNAGIWLQLQAAFWMMTVAGIFWFLPLAAYLLLPLGHSAAALDTGDRRLADPHTLFRGLPWPPAGRHVRNHEFRFRFPLGSRRLDAVLRRTREPHRSSVHEL
jgi:hypothetical protein